MTRMPSLRQVIRVTICAALLAVLAACSGGAGAASSGATVKPGASGRVQVGGRPFSLEVPRGYTKSTPVPLVVALHGYSSSGGDFVNWTGLARQADDRGFLLAYPDGTKDAQGERFWNATAACCDFQASGVDDSGYLSKVISTVEKQYAVDTSRVYVVGHSNGGFMALRMACEHADQVTAVVSIAGEMTDDPSTCKPARKVTVLQLQGDEDGTIHYDGGDGATGAHYPGAVQTVQDWRTLDACGATSTAGPSVDLVGNLRGTETDETSWSCADGTQVDLWTMHHADHVPQWSTGFAATLSDWLLAQKR